MESGEKLQKVYGNKTRAKWNKTIYGEALTEMPPY